jgi:hypothetical protein
MIERQLRSFWIFFRILFPAMGGLVLAVQAISLIGGGSFRDVDWPLITLLEAGAFVAAVLFSALLVVLLHFHVARLIKKRGL